MNHANADIPDRISASSLERITTLNFIRDAATRAGIEIVVGMLEPDGTIRVTSNTDDERGHQAVRSRLDDMRQQEEARKADRPDDDTLATDLELWRQYVDPYYLYTDDEFNTYPKDIKLTFIRHNGL